MRQVRVARAVFVGFTLLAIAFAWMDPATSVAPIREDCSASTASEAALYGYAAGYASAHGFRLSSQAGEYFRLKMRDAEADLANLDAATCRQRLELTRVNIGRYIDKMILVSRGFRDYHPGVLEERTFKGAQRALCPIWPFC